MFFSNNSRAVSVVLSSQVALQSSSSLILQEHPVTLSFMFEQVSDYATLIPDPNYFRVLYICTILKPAGIVLRLELSILTVKLYTGLYTSFMMYLLCNYRLFSCPRKQIIKTDFVVFSGTFLIRKCIIYSVHKINLALKLILLIFFSSIGSGGWISDGVRTVQSTRSSQGRTTVQCESTHLTSFAVLVDVTGVRKCMLWKQDIDYEYLLSPTSSL